MCLFCELKNHKDKLIYENDLVFAIEDEFPVSKGHLLLITKRHIETYFETTKEEVLALDEAMKRLKIQLDQKYKPQGYNIGINNGINAGQSILHLHLHLIPRYFGDVLNPRGGVRSVIPGKQDY
ncbi:MAG: HIT family protein [Firmicutes bacterium]|nr:HIT family protein [Bacillota bacterium]